MSWWWTSGAAPSTWGPRATGWCCRAPGQLLTTATAAELDISTSAAEYAKRAEAVTAVTVQLVEDEHGRRRFLDTPIDGRCTGWLLAAAPSGLLPFTSALSGAGGAAGGWRPSAW